MFIARRQRFLSSGHIGGIRLWLEDFFGTFDISNTLFSLTEPSSLPRGCFNKRREKGEACMSYSIIFTTHAYPSLLGGEEADDVRKKKKKDLQAFRT